MDPVNPHLELLVFSFVIVTVRYFLVAGGLYFIFYKTKRFAGRKIQPVWPDRAEIRRDILNSVSTILIFTVIFGIVIWMSSVGWVDLYRGAFSRGWTTFILEFVFLVFFADMLFYWQHRLFHTRRFYRWVHHTHHTSRTPTPWTALSFSPFEAIPGGSIIIAAILVRPLSFEVIAVFSTFSFLANVQGHLGFEFLPESIRRGKWAWFFNTTTNHDRHHATMSRNFGLYFTLWDRLCGTYRSEFAIASETPRDNARNV